MLIYAIVQKWRCQSLMLTKAALTCSKIQ